MTSRKHRFGLVSHRESTRDLNVKGLRAWARANDRRVTVLSHSTIKHLCHRKSAGGLVLNLSSLRWWRDPPMTGQDVWTFPSMCGFLCSSFSPIRNLQDTQEPQFVAQHGKTNKRRRCLPQFRSNPLISRTINEQQSCGNITHTKSKWMDNISQKRQTELQKPPLTCLEDATWLEKIRSTHTNEPDTV